MSKRLPYQVPAEASDRPAIWRSLGEKAEPGRRDRTSVEETSVQVPRADGASGSSFVPLGGLKAKAEAKKATKTNGEPSSRVGRRQFFAVGGATAAAVGLSGCLRRPAEHILPYSQAPEYTVPGIPLHYATSVSHRGEALGLLVESHEGRPTKIEGNPQHPASQGVTDAQIQGRILDLYDPDRSAHVLQGGGDDPTEASWSAFDAWWREKAEELEASGGRGLRILAPPTDSPSFLRARRALTERFPEARVHTWTPVSYSQLREGTRLAFGEPLHALVDYARPRAILALDCDFLGSEPGFLRNARRFAAGRRMRQPTDEMNRLYCVEGTLSLTGMNADHRLRLAPSQVERYLRALAAKLADTPGVQLRPAVAAAVRGAEAPAGVPAAWIEEVAEDLAADLTAEERPRGRRRRRGAVVSVGWRQPAHVHALAHAINEALGSVGASVFLYDPADAEEPAHAQSLGELAEAMGAGEVDTLVMLGGNPVYDAPADLGFAEKLGQVDTTIHLSSHVDETSRASTWHLPMAHELESWGDHRSLDGTIAIQQPLIAPLRGGRSDAEVLAMLGGIRAWRGYHLVRRTLREMTGPDGFDRIWRRSLHRGVAAGAPRSRPRGAAVRDAEVAAALGEHEPASGEGWEAEFLPSYQTYDGRQANNPWLLEMPDPVTKLVWDNAAYVSPASAEELGVRTGDLLTVSVEGGQPVEIAAFVLPGQADHVVSLPLGFGRGEAAGRYGADVGFDVYPARTAASLGFATGVTVRPAGGRYELVQTQEHHSMEGRPLSIDATLEQYRETPNFAQWRTPTPHIGPLWTQVDYTEPRPPAQGGVSYEPYPEVTPPRPDAPPRYKWGFVVDLTTCTGCSACVVACQAENNIPVVGKRQVELGREMHWMRLDRYFVGDDDQDPQVALQPVACQHCEEAPCENVCPVNATVHSPEGLNDMAYNRCIGTRYCMNNCPYKVRRFNFLDWHGDVPELRQMQFNPNVTVRMRGVMEKCTYCVQRIQYARIRARTETVVNDDGDVEERRIRPGELTPACAQACPSSALVFGDLNDTESPVHELAHLDRQYKLLAHVGTQPRTTYLGKIRNPNSEMG
ncbi:MAG TPA: 4Fe-4S dicluster domain-containing protein [Sandaracinaceae bacterium LLY-WYZ-13_1]|nr:4Fe-4S dicluster domain-containing protein [Sandaracinaceae bacterium LLY-WYZ-13_1]